MIPKNIFILSKHAMFGSGLKSLLGQDATLNVVNQEADLEEVLNQLEALRPEVIIVDGDEAFFRVTLEPLWALQQRTTAKIISLNLQNNWLKIYDAVDTRSWPMVDVHDLMWAVAYDFSPFDPTRAQEKEGVAEQPWLFLKTVVPTTVGEI
jgi:hypothetical protein